MFERLNEDVWDDEYTVKSLKEFLNSSYIDDDFPVRLGISEWNFSKSCNFYARQITSFGKPFVCLESMEINNDYNEIYDKWFDKKIENNKLKKENKELQKENEQLYELIDFVNTLIVFKSSESCQMEWEKRLKELKSE